MKQNWLAEKRNYKALQFLVRIVSLFFVLILFLIFFFFYFKFFKLLLFFKKKADSSINLLLAEKRKTAIEQKFLKIKEFVETKKIFEKEGFSFYFGNFGMILNM